MRNKRETDISRYTDKSADTGIVTEKAKAELKDFLKDWGNFCLLPLQSALLHFS